MGMMLLRPNFDTRPGMGAVLGLGQEDQYFGTPESHAANRARAEAEMQQAVQNAAARGVAMDCKIVNHAPFDTYTYLCAPAGSSDYSYSGFHNPRMVDVLIGDIMAYSGYSGPVRSPDTTMTDDEYLRNVLAQYNQMYAGYQPVVQASQSSSYGTSPQSAPQSAPLSVKLNADGFKVGDRWTITVTGPAHSSVQARAWHNGVDRGTAAMGTTNASGQLVLQGQFDASVVGTWNQEWTVGGRPAGNLNFVVTAGERATASAPPVKPVEQPGVVNVAQQSTQQQQQSTQQSSDAGSGAGTGVAGDGFSVLGRIPWLVVLGGGALLLFAASQGGKK